MSFFDKASLVTIPTAYKVGKLYSVKPSSGDFTFSRSTTATRINSNGLIEKARENLLLQSNTFNTTWTTSQASLTGGQTGYDGSNDGWLLESTVTGSSFVRQLVDVSSSVSTLSIYAKSGNVDWCFINAVGVIAYYDLSNGIVGTTIGTNLIDTNIESVGNGWYRISITGLDISEERIYPATTNGNPDSAVGDNIYIQDAQLEAGLVATDYIETTTSTVATGITTDVPRIDYNGTSPSLLLEPQRTNLVTQSEYLGSYTPTLATISDNAATSPEGVINAGSFVENTSSGRHRTQTNNFAVSSGSTYTLSMFVKNKSGSRLLCINADYLFNARSYFNIVQGVVEGTDSGSASIEDYGNGWYRCSVTGTSSVTLSGPTYIGLEDNAVDNGYVGDGTSGHYWYGMQLEQGSYPTSYIPTYGTSVTRTLDYTLLDDLISLGLVTATELTFFIDLNAESLIRDSSAADIIFGNISSNGIFIYNNGLNSMNGIIYLRDGSTTEAETLTQSPSKICIKVKPNDVKVFINGLNVATYTSLNFDFTSNSNLVLQSKNRTQIVNKLLFFPTALTDAECITLTTI